MIIQSESELMANQKHSDVMAPDKDFEVLQSQDGDSLFFSLGTDGLFYLTREARDTRTGWDKIDLSGGLARQLGVAKATAKTFCVAQNAQTGTIDLALAMTDGAKDYLFLSLGHSNTDLSWANGAAWTYAPFDAEGVSVAVLSIADNYILQNATGEFFVVDILKNPGNPLQLISRFFLRPAAAVKWCVHDLAVDLSAGGVVSALGQRAGDMVAGTYTFGKIVDTTELIFTQLYNPFKKLDGSNRAGFTARLTVPAGADAMAVATGPAGVSNVFVAGGGVLTLFAPDNQNDQAVGLAVVRNALFAGVQTLHAAAIEGRTAVYGVNQQGDLFYVACAAGSETTPAAWSTPLPILLNVERIAPYLNVQTSNNVIFAHVSGANLVQLTQDPVTTEWRQRSILLPSTDPDDLVSYNSFTTHLTVTDDFKVPQANVKLSLTSVSPVVVYANDVYHTLSPDVAIEVTTDATGVLTLVQETQALSAVCYQVDAGGGVTAPVNPMSKVMDILKTVQDGPGLGAVQVKNAKGVQRRLVPTSVSSDQKAATAEALKQFVHVVSTLPANGARKAPAGAQSVHPGLAPAGAAFHLAFKKGGWAHTGTLVAVGAPAAAAAVEAEDALGDLGSAISVAAGDFFNWVKNAIDDVVGFTIKAVGDIYYFFAKLGADIYQLVLDSISAVVQAVEFVFNKIKVFFEDLIAWLGFLFIWDDIVRTKAVLKNLLKLYALEAVAKIRSGESELKTLVTGLKNRIDSWAGLPTDGETIGATQKASTAPEGSNSPQANWGLHHFKSNMRQMTTTHSQPSGGWGLVKTILDDLENMVEQEGADFIDAFQKLKSEVFDVHTSLTPGELVKRVTGILLDLLLETAENILVTGLDIIAALIEGIVDMLDAPITIPVISAIYREVADDDLSILDLMCLVAAIPVTVVYKIVAKTAPFPDDELTGKMTSAHDLAGFKAVLQGAPPRSVAPRTVRLAAMTASPQAAAAPVSGDPFDVMTICLDIAGFVGSLLVVTCSGVKRDLDQAGTPVPTWLNIASFAAYLPYIAPNITGALGTSVNAWYTILNDGVTLISIAKTGLDAFPDPDPIIWPKKISPALECAINVIWLVPACGAIAASHAKTSDRLAFVGNAFFDIGGAFTPAMYKENWPPMDGVEIVTAEGFFKTGLILAGLYGLFCTWSAAYYVAGD